MAAAKEDDTVGGGEACRSGQAALAARLLKSLAAGASGAAGGNLIFSPLSIHVAVAMMSAGAGGSTLAEILAVAGAPSRPELEAFVRGVVMDRVLADQSPAGGRASPSRAARGSTRRTRSSRRTATPSSARTRAPPPPSTSRIT